MELTVFVGQGGEREEYRKAGGQEWGWTKVIMSQKAV